MTRTLQPNAENGPVAVQALLNAASFIERMSDQVVDDRVAKAACRDKVDNLRSIARHLTREQRGVAA